MRNVKSDGGGLRSRELNFIAVLVYLLWHNTSIFKILLFCKWLKIKSEQDLIYMFMKIFMLKMNFCWQYK